MHLSQIHSAIHSMCEPCSVTSFTGMEYQAKILLGHSCRALGKSEEAQEHYKKAEQLAVASAVLSEDQRFLALVFQQLCVYALGRNDEALASLLPLLDRDGLSKFSEGILTQALGNVFRSAADWHSAVKYLKRSIQIAVELEDKARVAERTGELGRAYRASGLFADALRLQHEFYDFALSRGDVAGLAAACGYIGFTTYSLSIPDYTEAITFLSCRSVLSQCIGDLQGYRWCLNNIGRCYLQLKHHKIAICLFEESAKLARQLGDLLGEGTSYGNMGNASRTLGRVQDAIKYHQLYEDNAKKRMDAGGVAIMQRELSSDFLLLEDYEMAQKYAFLALQTGLQIRACLKDDDDILKIANFEKNQSKVYSLLQFILIAQGLFEMGLVVSEMGRARALADLVAGRSSEALPITALNNTVLKAGYLSSSDVDAVVVQLGSLLIQLCTHLVVYSIVDNPIPSSSCETWLYCWVVEPPTAQGMHPHVHFHRTIFEQSMHTSSDRGFELDVGYFNSLMRELGVTELSVIRHDEPTGFRLSAEELHDSSSVRDIVPVARKVETSANSGKLFQLYDLLVRPLERFIISSSANTVHRVIFVPQGFLWNVPFPALRSQSYYLVEKCIISVSASIQLLFSSAHVLANEGLNSLPAIHALSVGNPKMPLDSITQLPGAEREAVLVNSILGGELLCGTEASKAEVSARLSSFSIVHLATHAILGASLADHFSDSPPNLVDDYSISGAIILAKSDVACSGVLTSMELQRKELSNELVVLSCCKSGCGKITGDGVLGLSRALISSGVKCLLVTLWSIHDDPTADLMGKFYKDYKLHRDAPFAMRNAMLGSIHTSPAYWGAFCIFGLSPNIVV